MARTTKARRLAQALWPETNRAAYADWRTVAVAIRRLPLQFWEPRMFFHGADDHALRESTGAFPSTFRNDRSTHPIYVLHSAANYGLDVCPCTSRPSSGPYIRQGCVLDETNRLMDRDAYILEQFQFRMPCTGSLGGGLFFGGLVPQACIRRRP